MAALSPPPSPAPLLPSILFSRDAYQAACGARLWNFEAGVAAEWTDRQTTCRFWLGLSSSVMEEDSSAFASLPSPLTPLEGTLFKSSHPRGQKHCGCKVLPTPNIHPHTHAETQYVHLVCLLTVDIAYQCPVPPAAMGQWLAGKWLLCLQHGCLIGGYVVLDLELPALHKFRWIVRPIKVAQRTWLDSVFSTSTQKGRTCTRTTQQFWVHFPFAFISFHVFAGLIRFLIVVQEKLCMPDWSLPGCGSQELMVKLLITLPLKLYVSTSWLIPCDHMQPPQC